MFRLSRHIATLACLVLAGCSPIEPDDNSLAMGAWRASIELPGGPASFGLEIGREGDGYRVTLINGQERVSVPSVRFEDNTLWLDFPTYNNGIKAKYVDDRLVGTLTLVKREETQSIPFTALPGSAPSNRSTAPSNIDVSGRWATTFTESDGSTYPAVGEFAQRGSRLYGTFLTPTGDYRYLGGELRGDGFEMSTFDGAHAFLFKANVLPDGSLHGEFWSGLSSHEIWIARRDNKASLPNPGSLTFLKPGYDRFSFEFPDLNGQSISLDDERFKGKVVIIMLAGSWCPNCHDEAAFMKSVFEEYKDSGLEVVALMFEHFDSFDEAAAQAKRFREKFSIEYTTLIAGSSDNGEATDALGSLNRVMAFPTTIFVARDGQVRHIHTGFSGPGTGEHYERLQNDFTSRIDTMLAEVAPPERRVDVEPDIWTIETEIETDEAAPGDTSDMPALGEDPSEARADDSVDESP